MLAEAEQLVAEATGAREPSEAPLHVHPAKIIELRRLRRLRMSLGMLAGQGRPPPHRMLHKCFAIRCPDSFDLGLLRALDTILGESCVKHSAPCTLTL